MGSGLSHKYNYTYGSDNEKRGTSKVREDILNYGKGREILRESSGTSNIDENASKLVGKFAPNEYGNFG